MNNQGTSEQRSSYVGKFVRIAGKQAMIKSGLQTDAVAWQACIDTGLDIVVRCRSVFHEPEPFQ